MDSGGGQQSSSGTQVTDLPEWAKPYAQKVLALGEGLTTTKDAQGNVTGLSQYQTYDAPRIAGFTQMQKDAFAGADSMTTSPYLGQAGGYTNQAIQSALGTSYTPTNITNQYQGIAGYDPSQFSNTFQSPGNYSPIQTTNQYQGFGPYQAASFQNRFQAPTSYQAAQFGYERAGLPAALQTYQMGPAERARSDSFDSGDASRYMSPYIEQAIAPQLREAARASEVQRNMDQATAVSKGAYGGSRQAIVEAERERNLGTLQNDIVNKGYQTAYEQATNQYNQDQARSMQAQVANQQAGLTVGQQNLAAALGVQQLGTTSGLQAALANQNAGLQSQQLAEQSRQFGAGQGLTAAQLQAQYGLSADQAEEASRQFASNQAANQAAQQAQYGQQAQQLYEQSRQFGAGQGMTAAQLMAQYGLSAQQAQEAANQYAYTQAMQQAGLQAQYGQSAQQLMEQANQYGAGLGLQGLQTALSGANQLGQLGTQDFNQQMAINNLLYQYGGAQQQLQQQSYNTAYQDFLNQQRYPYQQLEYMSNLIRGTPTGTVSTMYAAPTNTLGQLAGLGMGAYGLSQLTRAEGGTVSSYAEGGVTSQSNIESILDKLSDDQLKQAKQVALAERDAERAQMIDAEMAERASIRGGLGGAFNTLSEIQQKGILSAANGGIVAFAEPSAENNYSLVSSGQDYYAPPITAEELSGIDSWGPLKKLAAWAGRNVERDPETGETVRKASAPESSKAAEKDNTNPRDRQLAAGEVTTPRSLKTSSGKVAAAAPAAVAANAVAAEAKEPSFVDDLKAAREFLRDPEAEASRKSLMALIAKQGENAEDIKRRGIGNALAQFGFGMAAQASRPGQGAGLAGALRSAAGASPILAESAYRTQQAAAAAADNNLKMNIEMQKYNIAESKGDRAAMLSAAQNMRVMRQQQAQLDETKRSNIEKAAIMRQRLAASGGSGLQKAYLAGMSKAQDRASREATKLWGDAAERMKLEKQGITTFDQLLARRMKQHMQSAVPIYGVSPVGEDNED